MYQLFTDTSANLPTPICQEKNIHVIQLSYYIDDVEQACPDTEAFDDAAYYNAMKNGQVVTTSQITPARFEEAFRSVLEAGDDLIYIAMAQKISGTYDRACAVAEALMQEFPARRILVLNTKGAGFGEGLCVLEAARIREEGGSLDEAFKQAERAARYVYQVFTVDDLNYLGRTGRCSNFSAFVGSALGIKPLLQGSDDGQIVTIEKAHGRHKALKSLVKHYTKNVQNAGSQTVYISHANCPDDARALADLLREADAPKEIVIAAHEPATGAHLGPGALALFFMSYHNRDTKTNDEGYFA